MSRLHRRARLGGFLILLVGALSATHADAADAGKRPAVADLVGYFDTIVFGAEIDRSMAAKVVAKWQGPIRISVQGRVKKRHKSLIEKHVHTLARLSGLTFTAPKKDHNLYILFVRRDEMAKVPIGGVDPRILADLARPGGCYFLTAKKPPSRIVIGYIVVNVERRPGAIDHCLLEELTQSLGLPNDSNALRPSIFSDSDRLTKLSRTDRILLRTLYDRRMGAGLARPDALRVAETIVRELDEKLP